MADSTDNFDYSNPDNYDPWGNFNPTWDNYDPSGGTDFSGGNDGGNGLSEDQQNDLEFYGYTEFANELGGTSTLFQDGTLQSDDNKGTVTTQYPDGSFEINIDDGDVVEKIDQYGNKYHFEASEIGTAYTMYMVDGSKSVVFDDGTVVFTDRNNYTMVYDADGNLTKSYGPDGNEISEKELPPEYQSVSDNSNLNNGLQNGKNYNPSNFGASTGGGGSTGGSPNKGGNYSNAQNTGGFSLNDLLKGAGQLLGIGKTPTAAQKPFVQQAKNDVAAAKKIAGKTDKTFFQKNGLVLGIVTVVFVGTITVILHLSGKKDELKVGLSNRKPNRIPI